MADEKPRVEKLISDLRSGNGAAAGELLRMFGPLMMYVISPIISDPDDREECLQETVVKVWRRIDAFDSRRGSFAGWLTAVARNEALNRVRNSREHLSLEDVPEVTASKEPTPEERVLLEERRRKLSRAIESLSERERDLFYRKYYYRQSTAQMAAELGTTERALEGRLYRLRGKLRRMLGGESDG